MPETQDADVTPWYTGETSILNPRAMHVFLSVYSPVRRKRSVGGVRNLSGGKASLVGSSRHDEHAFMVNVLR